VFKEVKSNIYWVGSIDWNRRLFDELIPLPHGTSYNSYIIKGSEKTALIDTVDPTRKTDLVDNLDKLNVNHINYLVVNHAEQDHSGSIPAILELFPETQIVTDGKCKELLMSLLRSPEERFKVIKDHEVLSLGDKTLEFIFAPWVHWPETMLTYAREDRILFSCDLFGSHLATSTIMGADERTLYFEAKRYYAEIMMPYRTLIKSYIEKLDTLKIDIIAPGHGPLHIPTGFILNAYKDWVSEEIRNTVVIPYVSMHGSTEKMVEFLAEALTKRNIDVHLFSMTKTDIGDFAMALVDTATVVFGTPTVLYGAHPQIIYAAYVANLLKPKVKFASIIGSYGWGGKTIDQITGMFTRIKPELLAPVLVKGFPDDAAFKSLEQLADNILEKHKESGIVA